MSTSFWLFLLACLLLAGGVMLIMSKRIDRRAAGPLEKGLLYASAALFLIGVLARPAPPADQASDAPAPPAVETTAAERKLTPAQNIAILSDRPMDDAEIAERFARLDELCPEDGSQVADILVNMQNLLKEKGVERSVPELMRQMTEAQSGDTRVRCAESGAVLSLMMEKEN